MKITEIEAQNELLHGQNNLLHDELLIQSHKHQLAEQDLQDAIKYVVAQHSELMQQNHVLCEENVQLVEFIAANNVSMRETSIAQR